jgi:hypothetical protein
MYTTDELQYAINKVNVKCLICPKSIGPLNYHKTISAMIPNLPNQVGCPKISTMAKLQYILQRICICNKKFEEPEMYHLNFCQNNTNFFINNKLIIKKHSYLTFRFI